MEGKEEDGEGGNSGTQLGKKKEKKPHPKFLIVTVSFVLTEKYNANNFISIYLFILKPFLFIYYRYVIPCIPNIHVHENT